MGYYQIPPKRGGSGSSALSLAALAETANTVALWNFEETSGTTFTDEVNSIDLTAAGTTSISTYFGYEMDIDQVTNGGKLANISPGLTLQQMRLEVTGESANLSSSGSYTIEVFAKWGSDQTVAYVFATFDTLDNASFYMYYHKNGYFQGRVYATDGTFVTFLTSSTYDPTDLEVVHMGLQYDADNEEVNVLFNGSIIHTQDASSLTGKTIEIDDFSLFGYPGTSLQYGPYTIYQCRINHDATNGYGLS